MDNERQAIIEKILKLMAKTTERGATEAEAISAALIAQKMMNDYNIEQSELHWMEELIIDRECEIGSQTSFYGSLAATIAPNFRCKAYAEKDFQGKNHVHFYGYEQDVDILMITFKHLFTLGNRLANRKCREIRQTYGTSRGVYNNFAAGFIRGVQMELEKQSKALLIITPKEVEDKFIEDFRGDKFKKGRATRINYDNFQTDVYYEGRQAAIDGIRSRRIDGMLGLEGA